jgi:hypothetical protein
MAKPSVINQTTINATVINGENYSLLVDVAGITININKASSALINQPVINSIIINGLVTDNNVTLTQTHILIVEDAIISVVSTSPAPVMVFTFTPHNSNISISSQKVFIKKGQGGNLFVTVTEPDTTVYRFSFGGVKA